MPRTTRSLGVATAACALLAIAPPALASNEQLARVTITDAKFITRDGNALEAASKGNSVAALRAASHNLGLGLSEFIKDVTPIATTGSNGALAKTQLLRGLRKQRHGVQELNQGIKEALAGEKTKAKAEIAAALNEVAAGDRELHRAAKTIKTL